MKEKLWFINHEFKLIEVALIKFTNESWVCLLKLSSIVFTFTIKGYETAQMKHF